MAGVWKKIFGDQSYFLYKIYSDKKRAMRVAAKLREPGVRARVDKARDGQWAVWWLQGYRKVDRGWRG